MRSTFVLALFSLSLGCSSAEQGSQSSGGRGNLGGAGSAGAAGGTAGTGGTGGSGGDGPSGSLDDAEDYARFMRTIALPLVGVLADLEDSVSPEDPVACPGGGTAAIDRTLGEMTFTNCGLGGIAISGTSVVSQGSSAPPDKSALLLGALLTASGGATGSVQMQLAELTWQEPPTEAGTRWKASFQSETSGQICVQSSGEPCPS